MLGTANFAFGTYWAWPQHQEVKVGVSHSFHFIFGLSVWGVEPVVTHQTSRLESTGVCDVRQKQAGGSSVRKRAFNNRAHDTIKASTTLVCLCTARCTDDT